MISKYYLWTSVLVVNIFLFSSCLNSTDDGYEYSTDAQIYSIALSSVTDSASVLPSVVYTINQVKKEGEVLNGEIFNKEPLPYLFHVDSIALTINSYTSNDYYTITSFSKIEVTLAPGTASSTDSTYAWNGSDSISLPRLKKITTYAADGVTKKTYDFKLNIYQQDPYILNWTKIGENYLTSSVTTQKTIALHDSFITYYQSGTELMAMSSLIASDGKNWKAEKLTGIPTTILLSSLINVKNQVYALDPTTGLVYHSTDGRNWNSIQTTQKVVALYGELPFTTSGNILLAVDVNGVYKFGRANNDFSTIELMNDIPTGLPIAQFSTMNVESNSSYATRFIYLSGGITSNNSNNNDIWLLQDNGNGSITHIVSKKPVDRILKGSTLFYYDNKPYLISSSSGKNFLMYSDNNGASWVNADENQAFPKEIKVRSNASVITDANNYIWIFGGVSTTNTQIVDIWKGILNKYALN